MRGTSSAGSCGSSQGTATRLEHAEKIAEWCGFNERALVRGQGVVCCRSRPAQLVQDHVCIVCSYLRVAAGEHVSQEEQLLTFESVKHARCGALDVRLPFVPVDARQQKPDTSVQDWSDFYLTQQPSYQLDTNRAVN